MPDTITWPELVVLMALGPTGRAGFETLRGVLHTREVEPEVAEQTRRVARRGDLLRIETLDGAPLAIFGAESLWSFRGGEVPEVHDRRHSAFGVTNAELFRRPPLSRWDGDDFTQLTGPIERVEHLGRPAWAFELAPPPRKPYPVQMVVDAQTGIVLRSANRDFGSAAEWTAIEFDVELPDELFVWDGPTRDARAELDAMHEADMVRRREWLDARGVADLPIPAEPELRLNEWDDASGSFFVSIMLNAPGSLVRRPRSTAPWPAVETMRWPHVYRWHDARWDWCLAGGFVISDEQLALLKVRLASTT